MTEACPFCNLGTEKDRVIRVGKLTTIFLSNPRLMPGHTLVTPNRHIERPWELTDDEVLAVFRDIKFVEKSLLGSLATGFDIRENYRPFIPQDRIKIDHIHFHVLPRTLNDELFEKTQRPETELFKPLENDERMQIKTFFIDEEA